MDSFHLPAAPPAGPVPPELQAKCCSSVFLILMIFNRRKWIYPAFFFFFRCVFFYASLVQQLDEVAGGMVSLQGTNVRAELGMHYKN